MSAQEQGKQAAAKSALDFIEADMVIGVGSGSTVNYFIAELKRVKDKIEGAVAASIATATQLQSIGIPVLDLNSVGELPLYIDGADEIDPSKQMIKGGGGALLREKIIAVACKQFICIADRTKQVEELGAFPVAVEVIPMARSLVAREIVQLGGDPVYRTGFVTDNGNVILDVYNLKLLNPKTMEATLKNIVGVVESGIFAKRPADQLLVG
jgi:ribose 5-phosphate isomerase A